MTQRWDRRERKVRRRGEKPRSNRKNIELLISSIRAGAKRVLHRKR